MKKLVLVLVSLCLSSYGQAQDVHQLLKEKLDTISENPVQSISFYMENSEEKKITETAGTRGTNEGKVEITDQFRIASSTKLFVATIILQLEEEGKLKLENKICSYLKDSEYLRLDDFHFYENLTFSKTINIKQLLSHRSGLADIFNDRQDIFFSQLITEVKKQYTPQDIIDLYFEYGLNKEAKFKPGEGWHYSDMNYVLLGLLIEKLDNKSLSQSIRNRIIHPLDLKDTYFEFYEKPKTKEARLHQYVGSIDFNEVNTSFDWSGGGLVSTHKDLSTFITALFTGKLISEKSIQKMTSVQSTIEYHLPYGLGVYESVYNGDTYYGHYGFYGTYIGYCPESKTVLSYCISQATPSFNTYEFVNSLIENSR